MQNFLKGVSFYLITDIRVVFTSTSSLYEKNNLSSRVKQVSF